MIGRSLIVAAAVFTLSAATSVRHPITPTKAFKAPSAKLANAQLRITVQIKTFAFTPKVLTVTPGTTVTWANADEEPHTVTAVGGAFHSAALDTGNKYSFTFSKPGSYTYFCRLHPQMTATVVVRPR